MNFTKVILFFLILIQTLGAFLAHAHPVDPERTTREIHIFEQLSHGTHTQSREWVEKTAQDMAEANFDNQGNLKLKVIKSIETLIKSNLEYQSERLVLSLYRLGYYQEDFLKLFLQKIDIRKINNKENLQRIFQIFIEWNVQNRANVDLLVDFYRAPTRTPLQKIEILKSISGICNNGIFFENLVDETLGWKTLEDEIEALEKFLLKEYSVTISPVARRKYSKQLADLLALRQDLSARSPIISSSSSVQASLQKTILTSEDDFHIHRALEILQKGPFDFDFFVRVRERQLQRSELFAISKDTLLEIVAIQLPPLARNMRRAKGTTPSALGKLECLFTFLRVLRVSR